MRFHNCILIVGVLLGLAVSTSAAAEISYANLVTCSAKSPGGNVEIVLLKFDAFALGNNESIFGGKQFYPIGDLQHKKLSDELVNGAILELGNETVRKSLRALIGDGLFTGNNLQSRQLSTSDEPHIEPGKVALSTNNSNASCEFWTRSNRGKFNYTRINVEAQYGYEGGQRTGGRCGAAQSVKYQVSWFLENNPEPIASEILPIVGGCLDRLEYHTSIVRVSTAGMIEVEKTERVRRSDARLLNRRN